MFLREKILLGRTNCRSEEVLSGPMRFIGDVGTVGSRFGWTLSTGLAGSDLISSATNISQVVDAEEGTYYLLLECRQTLDNLGLTLTLGDTDYLRWGTPSVKL